MVVNRSEQDFRWLNGVIGKVAPYLEPPSSFGAVPEQKRFVVLKIVFPTVLECRKSQLFSVLTCASKLLFLRVLIFSLQLVL